VLGGKRYWVGMSRVVSRSSGRIKYDDLMVMGGRGISRADIYSRV
jgi:hypothetical protein